MARASWSTPWSAVTPQPSGECEGYFMARASRSTPWSAVTPQPSGECEGYFMARASRSTPWSAVTPQPSGSVRVISWQELHGALPGVLSRHSPEQCVKKINIRVRPVPRQELPGALSCCSCQVSECEEGLILGSV